MLAWHRITLNPATWPPVGDRVLVWDSRASEFDRATRSRMDEWVNWNWHCELEMTHFSHWSEVNSPEET